MTEKKIDKPSTTRQRSAPYPRYNLQQVEKFARIVFSEGPRNCDQDIIAKKASYSGSQNGSFFAMRSAASQFGLVVAKGDRISVSEEWITAFHEDTDEYLRYARQVAMKQPNLYSQLLGVFSDVQLPTVEKLARTIYLEPKYGVMKDAATEAVKTFLESAQYAGILDEKNRLRMINDTNSDQSNGSFSDLDDDKQTQSYSDSTPLHNSNRSNTPVNPSRSVSHLSTGQLVSDGNIITVSATMEKQEFTFRGGKKAYFVSPAPLPRGEKERLKQWLDLLKLHIDLTLEDEPEPSSQDTFDSNN